MLTRLAFSERAAMYQPPPIEPVPTGIHRPIWSVMIPTYNCAYLLVKTLQSVLAQDPGPELMQIEVVDDCSTRDDPKAVVREMGRGRIGFYRQPHNVGASRNFNTCIRRSVGQLLHILHGDDWVLPGFYESIELAAHRHPTVAFLTTRAFVVDESGAIDTLNPRTPSLERPSRDISPFVYANPFRTPSVVVRRGFYEMVGGFVAELVHTTDWEMWVRTISYNGGYLVNEPLACYRLFGANDSGRLARTGENLRDFLRLGDVFAVRYHGFKREIFVQMVKNLAASQIQRFRQGNDLDAASANERVLREMGG